MNINIICENELDQVVGGLSRKEKYLITGLSIAGSIVLMAAIG